MQRLFLLVLMAFFIVLLSGCESLNYYSQLVGGQWNIWHQRQSIDQLLADDSVESKLKAQLEKVKSIRQYAIRQLGLPDNSSYQFYTDLNRTHVVWNVFAAKEFSVESKRWCFPIAGCVGYRGYFYKQDAIEFARQLSSEGYDTYVGGISAYSTLGWFADPVLSTFVYKDDIRLAALIFHELAHQQLYLAGDTEFNESFATAVEIEGVTNWLRDRVVNSRTIAESDITYIPVTNKHLLIKNFLRDREIQEDFVAMVLNTRKQLSSLFKQDIPEQTMREAKVAIFRHFIDVDYTRFKARWGGYNKYDDWFNSSKTSKKSHAQQNNNTRWTTINNAKLSTVASYNQWLPSFQAMISDCRDNLVCFYDQARKLSALDEDSRRRSLEDLSN